MGILLAVSLARRRWAERGHDTTYRLLGLSRNGWVSVGVALGAGIWLWLRERRRPAAEVEAMTRDGDPRSDRARGRSLT